MCFPPPCSGIVCLFVTQHIPSPRDRIRFKSGPPPGRACVIHVPVNVRSGLMFLSTVEHTAQVNHKLPAHIVEANQSLDCLKK